MYTLENKTAFITGGGQGIGRGIALELAKAGANIVIAQRSLSSAETTAADVKALGREGMTLPLDVTDTVSIKEGVKAALTRFTSIDILINNAGTMGQAAIVGNAGIIEGELLNVPEDFDLCYDVNLKGIWNVTSQVIPHFKANGGGKIINISSVCGRLGLAALPAYGASKAASINLTQSLAASLGPYNINVNAICPGTIDTPGADVFKENLEMPNFCEDAAKCPLLSRLATPEDIGQAVVFLVSSRAKNITGQSLNIDGGLVMN